MLLMRTFQYFLIWLMNKFDAFFSFPCSHVAATCVLLLFNFVLFIFVVRVAMRLHLMHNMIYELRRNFVIGNFESMNKE